MSELFLLLEEAAPPPPSWAVPALLVEVDFTGNPSASYYDRHYSDPNVVSYWRLNNAGTLTDVKGANSGTVTNSPTLVTGALPYDTDQGLSFNGTDEDAHVAYSSSLTPSQVSLEAWVKVASYPASTKDLVGKRGSYYLLIASNGLIQFQLKNDTAIATVQTNAPLSTGVWHHIVGVADASRSYIYVDGVLDASAPHGGTLPELNLQPIRFAARRGTTAPAVPTVATNTGTGPDVTCLAPTGTAAGDLLVAHFHVSQDDSVTAVPAGWDLVANTNVAATLMARVYSKVATGSEPGSYTWTINGAHGYVIGITRFTGVDPLAALANPGYGGSTASGTSHATGSHFPNVDNSRVLALFSVRGNFTWTHDVGDEIYDVGDAGAVAAISACLQTQTTAASIQSTGTSSGTGAGSAFLIVVGGTGLTYTTASLDEVSLWNKGLTGNEVKALYESRLSGVGAWTDVTDDVRGLNTRTGRQYERDRIEAGTADSTWNDLLREYDSANTLSPYAPNVIPLRKVRAQATWNAVTYPLVRGFVEGWPSRWQARNLAEVQLSLVDGFEPLALAGVSGDLASGFSGAQISALLDKAQWPSTERAIDAGLFVMAAQTLPADAKALSEIQEIADSEIGLFFIDRDGVATFHDRNRRWTNTRSINSQATFTDVSTDEIRYHHLQPSFDKGRLVNEWKVSIANGLTATARDEASIALYFPRTQTRSTRLDALADAQTQATALLQDTAKPALRFDSLTVKPTTTLGWEKCLSLRISDRVTVIAQPVPAVTGSTITKDCFVEGISWRIAPGPAWAVTFQLSPVSSATYFDTIVRDAPVSYWRMSTAA